ncbi:hypothetical protein OPV22_007980 [Ensete ventricosum]|uniref:Uncharacterized protein n=1 Tax=Ensete ventricosum TaxID=4639 RepID=A0AAV8RFH2_ENSVE|nr:hypothetical protein OPV22_007980 [Ensete ventricosum]RZS06988.1 hypothetical protein BHM03_00037746 [Ensete ventricosum]
MGGGRRSPRIDPLTHPSLASSNQGKRWLAGISTWIPYHARRREGDEIFGSVPREISLESEEDLIMPMLNPTSVGDDDGCGRIGIGGGGEEILVRGKRIEAQRQRDLLPHQEIRQ